MKAFFFFFRCRELAVLVDECHREVLVLQVLCHTTGWFMSPQHMSDASISRKVYLPILENFFDALNFVFISVYAHVRQVVIFYIQVNSKQTN